jgi:hypothetical protein
VTGKKIALVERITRVDALLVIHKRGKNCAIKCKFGLDAGLRSRMGGTVWRHRSATEALDFLKCLKKRAENGEVQKFSLLRMRLERMNGEGCAVQDL